MCDKGTWWSITAYGDEIELLEGNLPQWIDKVYGGREECPTTKRIHFQGAIRCHGQQRFSKIKGWLPTAHIEVSRNAEALKKYVMKAETSLGDKKIITNPKKFYDAQAICRLIYNNVIDRQTDRQTQFWGAVENIIVETPDLTGQLMNPSLKNFWVKTANAWKRLEQGTSDSITLVPAVTAECPDCDRETYTCRKCYAIIYG